MSQYSDLLKHPKWQEMRLRVLDLAGFECSYCGSKEKTLHVHHGYYERGKKPWEYDDKTLHALCEDCHESEQEKLTDTHRIIGGLGSAGVDQVRGYAAGIEMEEYGNSSFEVQSHEMAVGIGHAWGVSADAIIRGLPPGGVIDGYFLLYLRQHRDG